MTFSNNTSKNLSLLAFVFLLGLFMAVSGWEYLPFQGTQRAEADPAQTNMDAWVTDGAVHSVLPAGNVTYIGGSFDYVGPNAGSGVPIDTVSGIPVDPYPRVNGKVNAVVPDGAGGWYIGGDFTRAGGVDRNRLAHVQADGSVSSFDPDANDTVSTLVLSGTTLYAGGWFTSVGGQPRNRIAALDTATGNANAWDPNADDSVCALTLDGTTLYAGGAFTSIGGQSRNRIAAIDTTTGNATAFDPGASSSVFALAISGSTLYAGGLFTTIGGQSRNRVAAIDTTTGNATAWDPDADDRVLSLALDGSTLYTGGGFTTIGGGFCPSFAIFPGVYTVTAAVAGGNGQVDPVTQQVDHGSDAVIDITPDPGYHTEAVTDNGVPVLPTPSDSYTVSNVTADHDVQVTFAPDAGPTSTWYLAEGYTGGDFDTWVLVQNPGAEDTDVTLTFQLPPGSSVEPYSFTLPAGTRRSIHLDEVPGLEDTDVSTKVTAGKQVVAERAMYFNYGGDRAGGHDSIGVTTPSDTWYLAEGYTGGDFDTWVLVQNPGTADAEVTLDFQLPPGHSAEPYTFILPAGTRKSIQLDELPGLEDTDVSTKVTSSGGYGHGMPVVAERAMYFDYQGSRAGGHDSVGVTAPADTWYLAEGYTGGEFDTWVLVQNPGTEDTDVTLTFQLPPGSEADPYSFILPAGTRKSIQLDELPGLADTDVSTKVSADQPVVAERAMYFNYQGDRAGGHDSIGYSP